MSVAVFISIGFWNKRECCESGAAQAGKPNAAGMKPPS
jgi:hypothetical protein